MADYNGGSGDDEYTGTAENDLISGGGGNDWLNGAGGHDVIDGGSGRNVLRGGDGWDTIYSLGDRDEIDGGEGDNQIIMTGLLGGTVDGGVTFDHRGDAQILSDLVFEDARFNSTSGTMVVRNFHTITGRLLGTEDADRLDLSGLTGNPGSSGAITILAGGGGDRVDGSHVRDTIFGDAQPGVEPVAPGGWDRLSGRGGDDLIYGDGGDDAIYGGGNEDELYGGTGADVVLGGSGYDVISGGRSQRDVADGAADRLEGGDGSDIIYGGYGDTIDGGEGDNGFDELVLDLGGGAAGVTADFDGVHSGGTLTLAGGSISGIEWLASVTGTGHDDDMTFGGRRLAGAGGNDRLSGGMYGNNLGGGNGDDVLYGLDGDDYLHGDAGNDVVEGGNGSDRLGYAQDEGDDILNGGEGDDRIYGGRDNDLLIGGTGSDQMLGGDGIDTASYAGGGRVTVRLDVTGPQFTFSSGNDTLSEIENLIGSDYGDRLTGNGGDNRLAGAVGDDELLGGGGSDTLVGGLGADTMSGGAGDDFYIVSDRGDVVVEAAGEGRDTVMSAIGYRLGDGLEDLRLAGTAVAGSGNAADNAILGNGADNRLNGLGGADELNGGAGDDALSGNAGDDLLIGGAGRDTLTGGAGADSFRFDDGDSAAAAGQSDVIAGFSRPGGDRIDLEAIDADQATQSDGAFTFIGGAAFSGAAGELRATIVNGLSLVQGDCDGDGSADFAIRVDSAAPLVASDFIL
jgi:Ca2+-binding RTX toxin-like protein